MVAALGAAALTALASLGVVWYQESRRVRASASEALHQAIVELLARSLAISLRARALGDLMKHRSGLTEGLDVATRVHKPVNLLELHDWVAEDFSPLNEACGQIWTRGDQEMVRLANAVVLCCADLLGVSTARQQAVSAAERLRVWVLGERWTPDMVAEHQASVEALAEARKGLADCARRAFGRDVVDLFA